jgi:hypothetical protein
MIFTMTKKRTDIPPPDFVLTLNKDQSKAVQVAIREFHGQIDVLESALGALIIGQHYGSRVLQMVHSPATIRKYESVIGLTYTDLCPERGTLAFKSIGLSMADKLGGFWKVVTGKVKVERKNWANEN